MDIDNIIKNSKTLSQLTKDISKIAKNGGGGGVGGKVARGATGINRIDQKIDDVKSALGNNTTVQFFKDPAAVLGKGMRGVIQPFTDFLPNMVDQLKKFNPFGNGSNKGVAKSLSRLSEATENNTRLLEIISGNTLSGDEIAGGMQEALGQTVMRDSVKQLNLQDSSLKELSLLRTQFAVLPDQMIGVLAKPINSAIGASMKGVKNFGNMLFKKDKGEEQVKGLSQVQHELAQFGKVSSSDTEAEMHQKQSHHNELLQANNSLLSGSMADKLSAEHLHNIENILLGDTDVSQEKLKFDIRERRRMLAQDQAMAESKRDDMTRQTELFEGIGAKLEAIGDALGMGGENGKTSKKAGGIFDWIKKNFMGIGGGLLAGATIGGGAISGLFLGMINVLTEGFRILGRRRVMVTRGAGVLAIMGLSLLPFAGSLAVLNKAMNGFTLKKVGVFAAMLGVLGATIAGFAIAIATGVGGVAVAGAIGLLALLGAALLPFGKAISMAGDGIEPAADLFSALAAVKWSSFFLAGPALNALASSLRAFKGLPDIAGDNSSAFGMIGGISDKITASLPNAAKPIQDFNTALAGLSSIKLDNSIGNALSGIYKAVDKRDFQKRLEAAGKGMKSLLGSINSELNKMEGRALDKVMQLLNSGETSIDLIGSTNTTGAQMYAGSAMGPNGNGGSFINVDNSTGGTSTNIQVTQQTLPHVNDTTMSLLRA